MSETPAFLAERLRSEGEKSVQFFHDMRPEYWACQIYTDGAAWTVRQVLAHFVQAEISLLKLVNNIAAGGLGTPDDFQLNTFNERQAAKLDEVEPEELIRRYLEMRESTAARVSQLTPEDLDRRGRHPWLGIAPLVEIIKLIYRHNQIHLREIRRSLFPAEKA